MAPPIAKLARAFGLNGSMLDVRMRGPPRARARASISLAVCDCGVSSQEQRRS